MTLQKPHPLNNKEQFCTDLGIYFLGMKKLWMNIFSTYVFNLIGRFFKLILQIIFVSNLLHQCTPVQRTFFEKEHLLCHYHFYIFSADLVKHDEKVKNYTLTD